MGSIMASPTVQYWRMLWPITWSMRIRFYADFFSRMWGDESLAGSIYHFAKSIGAPLALRDYGVTVEDVPGIVDRLLAKGFSNPPRCLERDALTDMLGHIVEGRKPV